MGDVKIGVGDGLKRCSYKWINARAEILEKLGLVKPGETRRGLIYAKWRSFLLAKMKDLTLSEISNITGVVRSTIRTDIHKMALLGDDYYKDVVRLDGKKLIDDPIGLAKIYFTYDTETGLIYRRKVSSAQYIRSVGQEVTSDSIDVCHRKLSRRQLAWLFIYGELPKVPIKLKDKDGPLIKANMYQSCMDRLDSVDRTARKEKVIVLGREKTLMVESSTPKQPRTESNAMRTSGQCFIGGICEYYKKCGDNLFLERCYRKR